MHSSSYVISFGSKTLMAENRSVELLFRKSDLQQIGDGDLHTANWSKRICNNKYSAVAALPFLHLEF